MPQQCNRKRILNTATGEVYKTAGEAAKAHGMHRASLSLMLNGQRRNRTALAFFVEEEPAAPESLPVGPPISAELFNRAYRNLPDWYAEEFYNKYHKRVKK